MRQFGGSAAAAGAGPQSRAQAWFLLDLGMTFVMLSLTAAFVGTLARALH